MTHGILVFIFGLFLLPGLIMAFVPMLPAFWFLFAAASVFALLDGFVHITTANLAVLAGIFALSIVVDWSAGLLGAKFGGATWKSLLYGMIGSVIGLFIFPPLGIFAGLFVGVLIGELLRKRHRTEAVKAATGALLGSVSGVVVNVCLAFVFLVAFILFAAF